MKGETRRFKDFSELAKAMPGQDLEAFLNHAENEDWDSAYESIKCYSLNEQQRFAFKAKIAIAYYHKFKETFSNRDFKAAQTLIDRAFEVDSHNELIKQRRSLYHSRKSYLPYTIDDAEKGLLQHPTRKEPRFNSITRSYSMGVYKWTRDSERCKHDWSKRIADFKGGDRSLSIALGNLVGEFILERTDLIKSCDIIVPVASDPVRSFKREFEITQELARGVQEVISMPIVGSYLLREESDHAKNLSKHDLFRAYFSDERKSRRIEGKTILLIDDICTTGRTLERSAQILRSGGAERVYSVVLARAESTQRRAKRSKVIGSEGQVKQLAHWFCLSAAEKLGPVKSRDLINVYGNPEKILEQTQTALMENKGIGEKIARAIVHQSPIISEYYEIAETQILRSEEIGSHIVTLTDPQYPSILYNSKMPVPLFHVRGRLGILTRLDKTIAIVGSRKIHAKATEFIKSMVPALVADGWAIISGMAVGVDHAAHESCLDTGGSTIGVLGNGVDIVYPPENQILYSRMVKDGTLVTEYNLGSKVSEIRLKRRNRIIVGLSKAVFVVQSTADGGAMNAVRAAHESQIPVLTWSPSDLIDEEAYSGNRNLINSGEATAYFDGNLIQWLNAAV